MKIDKSAFGHSNFIEVESFVNFNSVSGTSKHRIQELLNDASQFNANDLLVNCQHGNVLSIPFANRLVLPMQNDLKQLVSTSIKTKKEQGVFSLCIALGLIDWELKGEAIETPLFLFPCSIEILKVTQEVKISIEEEEAFINPFLIGRLRNEFSIEVPSTIRTVADLGLFLEEHGFSNLNKSKSFIGNFHHHRFEILKELEELLEQSICPSLSQLLGDEHSVDSYEIQLGNELLYPADLEQLAVFKSIETYHTVVQGPPGTGKSQVLTNLLAKLVLKGKSAVVVSEKRVALEVLEKKMQHFDLGHLCFVATSETLTKDILTELKANWQRLEQENKTTVPTNLLLSEQYRDQLQQSLDLMNRSDIIGGISYSDFRTFLGTRKLDEVPFSSDLPDMKEWLHVSSDLKAIYENQLNELIGFCSSGSLHQEDFLKIDQAVQSWIVEITQLKKRFEIHTWNDFQEAMKKAALCQNFSNPIVRKHETILKTNSKEQKRFIKLRKHFLQAQMQHATLELEKGNWKKFPTMTETLYLFEQAKSTSLIGKWKFKKQWSTYSNLPTEKASEALQHWKRYLANIDSISQIKVELCEIGVDELPLDLELIQQQLHYTSEEERSIYAAISKEERSLFADQNALLNKLYSQFKTNFRWQESTEILPFLEAFLKRFESITFMYQELKTLPEIALRNIKNHPSFDAFEIAVCKHNWVKFTSQFPSFADFNPSTLLEKAQHIIVSRSKEATLFAAQISLQQRELFQSYHTLLQTPPSKLTTAEKEFRLRLKKGKAILVKEFSKTRNHPSLRELFASDAQDWIRLFKPIWLSNPAQIAKCFPMQENLFDVAIFDEASQLPLQNALGTIQRAKRILVAGDQEQMGPSSYFKTGNGEVVDLLHQASFYWKNVALRHHYRSEHPALIQFSNKHFYNNELLAFPSFLQEKNPIIWHFCEQGRFIDRKNKIEAKEVANLIEKEIDSKNHLGIVAFSETQLLEINACLSPKTLQLLEERIENDTAFFKALENVQGEECDHLIISFGYGYSKENEFHLRFGPMNSKNGTKRLNVLLTRARKKIEFFSSVKAGDFKLSSNEAVNLLRQFLLQLENNSSTQPQDFPLGLQPKVDGKLLTFGSIHEQIHQAEELITLVGVLESRGWQLQFS